MSGIPHEVARNEPQCVTEGGSADSVHVCAKEIVTGLCTDGATSNTVQDTEVAEDVITEVGNKSTDSHSDHGDEKVEGEPMDLLHGGRQISSCAEREEGDNGGSDKSATTKTTTPLLAMLFEKCLLEEEQCAEKRKETEGCLADPDSTPVIIAEHNYAYNMKSVCESVETKEESRGRDTVAMLCMEGEVKGQDEGEVKGQDENVEEIGKSIDLCQCRVGCESEDSVVCSTSGSARSTSVADVNQICIIDDDSGDSLGKDENSCEIANHEEAKTEAKIELVSDSKTEVLKKNNGITEVVDITQEQGDDHLEDDDIVEVKIEEVNKPIGTKSKKKTPRRSFSGCRKRRKKHNAKVLLSAEGKTNEPEANTQESKSPHRKTSSSAPATKRKPRVELVEVDEASEADYFYRKAPVLMACFECVCGKNEDDEMGRGGGLRVQCESCGTWQHPQCVHYDLTDAYRGRYLCPHCHAASVSNGTLLNSHCN